MPGEGIVPIPLQGSQNPVPSAELWLSPNNRASCLEIVKALSRTSPSQLEAGRTNAFENLFIKKDTFVSVKGYCPRETCLALRS